MVLIREVIVIYAAGDPVYGDVGLVGNYILDLAICYKAPSNGVVVGLVGRATEG